MEITVKAPAKINLYLDILDRREDGYHDVNMIMQSVSLFDTVTVLQTDDGRTSITSNFNFSGDEEKNTAYIAADEFFKHTGIQNRGLKIHLEKQIPVCAGLAGGSTNAAAVLVALNEMFNTNLAKCDLAAIGKKVGADVPFCIFGGTMISTGTGTTLKGLPYMPDCHIVLVKPRLFVSTKKAYTMADEVKPAIERSMKGIIYAINSKSLSLTARRLYNKFENVLQFNEVYRIKGILKKNGALGACMSGSGPSVFGVFNDKATAEKSADILKQRYRDVFLCEPTKRGCYIEK